MTTSGLPPQIAVPHPVPAVLSFVAGYVDSCIFLALFGLYVAQVTGSFVIAGTEIVVHDEHVLIRIIAIPVFIFAAMLTTVIATIAYRQGRIPLLFTLGLETALLAATLTALLAGAPFAGLNAPAAILAGVFGIAAMGVQSALVRLLMRGVASTNVMTTNTTVVAIDVTEMIITWIDRRRGQEDDAAAAQYAAARDRFMALWPLGVGFFLGTVCGAIAYQGAGAWALAIAVLIVLGLTVWAAVVHDRRT